MKPVQKVVLYASLAIILVAVFAMYGRPEFFMSVANHIWGCF